MLFSGDLGNGYIKARSTDNTGISFPAVISVVSDMLGGFNFDLSKTNHDFVIGFEGKSYAIGETVRLKGLTPVTIAHRSRIETDFYRIMFASALAATIWEDCSPSVVLSLPPAAYWDKDKIKQALQGIYKVEVPGYRTVTYDIPQQVMRIIPEGVGAVCLLVLDKDGNDKQAEQALSKLRVGVVDVGTYTTDLIQLDQLRIVRAGCDSLPHALHDVHEKVRNYCQHQGYDLDMYRADEVLNAGYFMRAGVRHSISEYIDDWTGDLIPAISGMIRTKWNGGDDVDAILLTGGGSLYIYDRMAMEFPHVRLVEQVPPHFANCEGAYRYGLLRERNK